jgi:hypothetical protein
MGGFNMKKVLLKLEVFFSFRWREQHIPEKRFSCSEDLGSPYINGILREGIFGFMY